MGCDWIPIGDAESNTSSAVWHVDFLRTVESILYRMSFDESLWKIYGLQMNSVLIPMLCAVTWFQKRLSSYSCRRDGIHCRNYYYFIIIRFKLRFTNDASHSDFIYLKYNHECGRYYWFILHTITSYIITFVQSFCVWCVRCVYRVPFWSVNSSLSFRKHVFFSRCRRRWRRQILAMPNYLLSYSSIFYCGMCSNEITAQWLCVSSIPVYFGSATNM